LKPEPNKRPAVAVAAVYDRLGTPATADGRQTPAPAVTDRRYNDADRRSNDRPLRVLIADDHAVVRRGLKQILSEGFPNIVAGEAHDGADAVDQALSRDWDLVLLDIGMPGRGGIDTLVEIKRVRPHTPVLVVSMQTEEQYGARALRAGAAGYVTKDKAPEELLAAVRKALAGGRYVSPSLAEKLALDVVGGRGEPHENLSRREFEVLCLIGRGKSIKEIATELSLSPKTISTYHVRLMEKMGMRSDGELMRYAIERRL
jgi:two-component system, NarL family, invasion response regulator UvrY